MYVALHEVTWCMVVWCTQNLHQDGSSFEWHQLCQRCKYTALVDIKKMHYKNPVTHVELNYASTVRERRIALYKRSSVNNDDHIQTLYDF